ncbi:di-haem cytochrome c peroxidase family protein [marine gamma proteobacterium HTCC2207]|uniref:Di-haem cytochrome c peroxidase family protein n=1 Tax=gamma proteobacterium HTCC2207 TaxID=314287 RepID=Q1YU87_9GAMM|nr:di-haem cytochrome c peroxidase family protein [marine gamma proteobacterium HTCC2207] [gamma proteobacterium HTCC2207]
MAFLLSTLPRQNLIKQVYRLLLLSALGFCSTASSVEPATTTLSSDCPASFLLSDNNQCLLRNLYQLYNSLGDHGIGGLKTALPAHRDGFSPEQIDLGRLLFFDPVLSADQSVSCASCHNPSQGFSDGLGRSVGIHGQLGSRSAPSLWNSAFLKDFFWDARSQSLEEQALSPLFSPQEMGNNPSQLLSSLRAVEAYPKLFKQAFPDTKDLSLDQIATALAAFQSSLISLNSRYDQYAHGYGEALNAQEIEGLNIFRSFVARCSQCHMPPLFTNQQIAVIGSPEPEDMPRDIGAEKTFDSVKLKGGFKVPSLRNIAETAPYMHSGRFQTLREVAEFYSGGRGHAVPEGEDLLLHWHISEPDLNADELDRLVDFMRTLSDSSMLPTVPHTVPSGLTTISGKAARDNNSQKSSSEKT